MLNSKSVGRILALVAIVSVLLNAQCVSDCAFRSCFDFRQQHDRGSCHHKAPAPNHSETERPCSHQILSGSQLGTVIHPVVPIAAIHAAHTSVNPAFLPFDIAPESQSPPPESGISRTTVLRI